MIDSAVLMRRAVRWVMESHNLLPGSLALMSTDVRAPFEDLAISVADDMQYNQLKYFRPFEHQK